MRKMMSVLVFFLLTGSMPVQAQIFGHDSELDRLVRSNQRMVNRMHHGGGGYDRRHYGGHQYYRRGHRGSNDAWIGLGLGAVAGALLYGALSNRDSHASASPSLPKSSYQDDDYDYSSRENGWNSRVRERSSSAGGSWFDGRPNCRERGMFVLKNESGETIRVYQDGRPYAVIRPNRSKCGDPFAEYEAEAIVAVSDGYTARASMVRAKPEGQSGGVWVWR